MIEHPLPDSHSIAEVSGRQERGVIIQTRILHRNLQSLLPLIYKLGSRLRYIPHFLQSLLKICARFGYAERENFVQANIFLEICFGLDFKPRNIPYIKANPFVNLKMLKRIGLSRKTSYSKTKFQIYCFEVHTCVHQHTLQSFLCEV